jgi:hypothetical protein
MAPFPDVSGTVSGTVSRRRFLYVSCTPNSHISNELAMFSISPCSMSERFLGKSE